MDVEDRPLVSAPRASRRGDQAYHRFWHEVGDAFPDLGGAPSTAFYRENEIRLLEGSLPPLTGLRILKTDLWDEAKNTRILQWVASRGALAFGVDLSAPITRDARRNFGSVPLRGAVADVRSIHGVRRRVIDCGREAVAHFDSRPNSTSSVRASTSTSGILVVPAKSEPSQIERPGSPSMTCWRSRGRSPGFQSDAVWTTR